MVLYPLLDAANDGAGREYAGRANQRRSSTRATMPFAPYAASSGGGWASQPEGALNVLTAGARVMGAPFLENQDIASSFRQLMNPMEGKTNVIRCGRLSGQLPRSRAHSDVPPEIAPVRPDDAYRARSNPRQLPKKEPRPLRRARPPRTLAGQMQRGYGQTINQLPGLLPSPRHCALYAAGARPSRHPRTGRRRRVRRCIGGPVFPEAPNDAGAPFARDSIILAFRRCARSSRGERPIDGRDSLLPEAQNPQRRRSKARPRPPRPPPGSPRPRLTG